jgi:hypothetical protein
VTTPNPEMPPMTEPMATRETTDDPPSMGTGLRSNHDSQDPRQRMITRLVVWSLFGVIFGLLPLIALSLKGVLSKDGFHFGEVLGGGELFVVSAVLAAGAMGELFAATFNTKASLLVIWAGFFCLLCFAGNTMAFMQVGSAPHSAVVDVSAWFFPPTLLASGVCVGTAALR